MLKCACHKINFAYPQRDTVELTIFTFTLHLLPEDSCFFMGQSKYEIWEKLSIVVNIDRYSGVLPCNHQVKFYLAETKEHR
jgi:hypothetical protein